MDTSYKKEILVRYSEKSFTLRMAKRLQQVLGEAVESSSLQIFKT